MIQNKVKPFLSGDFSMPVEDSDTHTEPLKLPPISAAKQSPSPLYMKALDQKTKLFISRYSISPYISGTLLVTTVYAILVFPRKFRRRLV